MRGLGSLKSYSIQQPRMNAVYHLQKGIAGTASTGWLGCPVRGTRLPKTKLAIESQRWIREIHGAYVYVYCHTTGNVAWRLPWTSLRRMRNCVKPILVTAPRLPKRSCMMIIVCIELLNAVITKRAPLTIFFVCSNLKEFGWANLLDALA